MDTPGGSSTARDIERAHLELAHHEICTALTVFRLTAELVRIELRGAPVQANHSRVHAHLDELERAVDRLRDVAREMKRWHKGTPLPSAEAATMGAGEQTTVAVRLLS